MSGSPTTGTALDQSAVPVGRGGLPGENPCPEGDLTTENRVNPVVFVGSIMGVLAVAGAAMAAPEATGRIITDLVNVTADAFGWFYILLGTAVVVFVILLGVSRYGRIKLGPDHAKPEFSTFSWAAMLFAAGIGTDLMFFSVAEPVTQYLTPPRGPGSTLEAAEQAPVWTLFHYGITGWGMYCLMGMALGYFAYRRHQPLAVRSALVPVFGSRMEGPLGHLVDVAAVLGTIFGVAASLGIGVVFLNVGLEILFGVPQGLSAQTALVVIAVVMAAVSATTGVDKGIRVLSQMNVLLAIGLAAWVLVTGNSQFLLNALVQNIGGFVVAFPGMSAQTFAYDQPTEWMSSWTLFFWAWWIAWASFVGLFLARISQGRTIRQFVAGTMVLPFSYIVMWVSIFGNSAIERIRSGDGAFAALASAKPEQGFYTLLQQYPAPTFLVGVATFVGLLFYVTSADSGALVMANLSSRLSSPYDDGKPWLRIVWAAVTGVLTIAMLFVGGISTLQKATVVMGLPFAVVMVLVMVGLYRALQVEGRQAQARRHRFPPVLPVRAPLPGGATASVGQQDASASAWKARLARAMELTDVADADRYLSRVVEPALRAVAAEFVLRGQPAEVEVGESFVDLRTSGVGDHPFVYRVELDQAPVPAYGGRMMKGRSAYARLEVHLANGGQEYDVMGYNRGQLIHDVLDQYEGHLEFLRLEDAAT
nr:choline BCCT transporter BetT [Austwickia chelonae]